MWHAAQNFSTRQQNSRCVFFRVCLSCEAKKQCCLCKAHLPVDAFGPSAWKRRDRDRQVCLRCQKKTRGRWLCSTCRQKLPQTQFTTYLRKRTCVEPNGRQECNRCYEHRARVLACSRAAKRAIPRLEPLRKRARNTAVLRACSLGSRRSTGCHAGTRITRRPLQRREAADNLPCAAQHAVCRTAVAGPPASSLYIHLSSLWRYGAEHSAHRTRQP